MKTMNATDAKNKFGELIDAALVEPVAIQKNGREVAVLVSKEDYDKRFQQKPSVDLDLQNALGKSMSRWHHVYEELAK